MPLTTTVFVILLGLWPGTGLVLASAAPTAVNTLLFTMELGGDWETAGDIVFWTTIASSVTVAIVLAILQFQEMPQFEKRAEMTTLRTRTMGTALAIFCLVAVTAGKTTLAFEPAVGKALPDFTLPRINNGEPVSLSDYRGQKVLLIMFASW